jgi:hypothetical protein
MRYIPVGVEAQLDRFAISIKFVTAESEIVPNAARNIPPPLAQVYEEIKLLIIC